MNREPFYLSIENDVLRDKLHTAKELVRKLAREMKESGVVAPTLEKLIELLK